MIINYKDIGDTLTTAELNAYASLLAHNKILIDSFRLKNGTIAGNYGEYTFDLSNASIVDNGILITDETLSNDITVKLSNPTQYATYTLHFTVVRYGDVNILDETTDNIETFDLTLDLIDGETVNIPLDTLQEYDVILFNSNITIKHDKPEIIGKYITALDITGDKSIIQTQETSTLEITATDLEHLPMPNKSIQLLKNNTLLDTLTTDQQGKATYTYTGAGSGKLDFIAKYRSLQSETYTIYDTITYDNATTSDHKDIWELTNATLTRENTYSRFYETTTGTGAVMYTDFPNVQIIEFDVLQEDGTTSDALFGFYQDNSGKTTFQLRQLAEEVELNTWYRVQCIVEENKITIINKDTEYQTIREFTGIINRGRFATSGTTTALQFRNFKAY